MRHSWYEEVKTLLATHAPAIVVTWRDDDGKEHIAETMRTEGPQKVTMSPIDVSIDISHVFLDNRSYGSHAICSPRGTGRVTGDGSRAELLPLSHGLYLRHVHFDATRNDGTFHGPSRVFLCGWGQVTSAVVKRSTPAPRFNSIKGKRYASA